MIEGWLQYIEANLGRLSGLELFCILVLLTWLQEDSVLLLCAALVARGTMSFEMAFWANATGVLFGDFILYWIAAGLSKFRDKIWFLGRLLSPERLMLGQKLFKRWGIGIVFLSKFTPALRTPLYLSMGFVRSGFWSFALAISISGILWILIVLKGVVKAEKLGLLPLFIGLLLVGLIGAQVLSWRWRKKFE